MSDQLDALRKELESNLRGDVLFDDLSRTLYSTDASFYEIVPAGVVRPKDVDDIVATVQACGGQRISITPRGAGTGLTGGAVGDGMQLDLSRYQRGISDLDPTGRTVRVEPGVVLDDLNRALAGHGLQFAPDVATSSRATIGGMIANNSCGAHSVVYGRTADHVAELTCVLADGSTVTWGNDGGTTGGLPGQIRTTLEQVRDRYRDQIVARYPNILRKNSGYGLDRLLAAEPRIDPATIVCGSEGTLCVVAQAVLTLTPLPKTQGLLVVEFARLLDALSAVPPALDHGPAAVELIDRMILTAARRADPRSVSGFVTGDPEAILVVELFDDDERSLGERLERLESELSANAAVTGRTRLTDAAGQAQVWSARKQGLGLLMSRPGDAQPYGFRRGHGCRSAAAAGLHRALRRVAGGARGARGQLLRTRQRGLPARAAGVEPEAGLQTSSACGPLAKRWPTWCWSSAGR